MHLQSPRAGALLPVLTSPGQQPAAKGTLGGLQGAPGIVPAAWCCTSWAVPHPNHKHRHSSTQEVQPQEGCCKSTSAANTLRLLPGAVNSPTASPHPLQ